ncbi:uncharacterized protein QTN25_007351 [Entamoeba marina]
MTASAFYNSFMQFSLAAKQLNTLFNNLKSGFNDDYSDFTQHHLDLVNYDKNVTSERIANYKIEYNEILDVIKKKESEIESIERVKNVVISELKSLFFTINFDELDDVIKKQKYNIDILKFYINRIIFVFKTYCQQVFQSCNENLKENSLEMLELKSKHLQIVSTLEKAKLNYSFNPNSLEPILNLHSPQKQIKKWLNWKNCSVIFDSSIDLDDGVKIAKLKYFTNEHVFVVLYDDCNNVFGAYLNPSLVEWDFIIDPHCFVCSFKRNGKNKYKTYSLKKGYKPSSGEMNWLDSLGVFMKSKIDVLEVMNKQWYYNPYSIDFKEKKNALVDDSLKNEFKITRYLILSKAGLIETPKLSTGIQQEPNDTPQTQVDQVNFNKPVRIYVRTLTGKTLPIKFKLNGTVKKLKKLIQKKEDIALNQQRLVFAGKQLEDEKILTDYNIREGYTLHLVLRLRCDEYCSFF